MISSDSRSIKARAILAGADRWTPVTLRSGAQAFRILSQSIDGEHMTSVDACTCPYARWNKCKHRIAVELYLAKTTTSTAVLSTDELWRRFEGD
jgi:hypothetical protein